MINFTYDENISDKNNMPLLNCKNIRFFSEDDYIVNYFIDLYTPYYDKGIIDELNKIYDYSQKVITIKKYENTISKESWLQYKIANNISIDLNEKILKVGNIIKDKDGSISVKYNREKDKTLNFNNEELYNSKKSKSKPLFETYSSKLENTNTQNILYLHKEGNCKNKTQFLHYLLNCIFNSNQNYYIKKCERCNKYFLATIPNKKMCYRKREICGKSTICSEASKIFYKSKEYKRMQRLVENHLKKFYSEYNTDFDYINIIREKFTIIKNDYIENDRYQDNVEENFIKKVEELIANKDF